MSKNNVFIINENIVQHWGKYSFGYSEENLTEVFKEYKNLSDSETEDKITSIALIDPVIDNFKAIKSQAISYESILSFLYKDIGLQKAQIVDIASDHVKFTEYKKEWKNLSVKSQKIEISSLEILENVMKISPRKLDFGGIYLDWLYENRTSDTGYPELNSAIINAYIKVMSTHINPLVPLIILTDLDLNEYSGSFFIEFYRSQDFSSSLSVYNKSSLYLFSHNLIEDRPLKKNGSFIWVPPAKNKDTCGSICFISKTNNSVIHETLIIPNQINAYEINPDVKVKIISANKNKIFESQNSDYIVLNSNDNFISKKNR